MLAGIERRSPACAAHLTLRTFRQIISRVHLKDCKRETLNLSGVVVITPDSGLWQVCVTHKLFDPGVKPIEIRSVEFDLGHHLRQSLALSFGHVLLSGCVCPTNAMQHFFTPCLSPFSILSLYSLWGTAIAWCGRSAAFVAVYALQRPSSSSGCCCNGHIS